MARYRSMASFVATLGYPLCLGCSTSSPSVAAVCDVDAGAIQQGNFCLVAEVSAEVDAAGSPQGLSFSGDVQPVLTHYCGVVGCHVSGSPTGGLNLAPGFSYDQLVDAQAAELQALPNDGGAVYYVVPGDLSHSYLHIKVHPDLFAALKDAAPPAAQSRLGTEMPAKATGSVLDPDAQAAIDDWIGAGAPRN